MPLYELIENGFLSTNIIMTTPHSQDHLAEARQVAAERLEQAMEKAQEVTALCEKASRLSHKKMGAAPPPLSTKPNARDTKRLRGH